MDIDLAISLLEMTQVAYLHPKDHIEFLLEKGMRNYRFFENDGAQAFGMTTHNTVYIIFRGSQITSDIELSDILSNFDLSRNITVHKGALRYYNLLKQQIENYLAIHADKKLVMAGHSLGGAMATIASLSRPEAVCYTFASLRVLSEDYTYRPTNVINIHNSFDFICELPTVFRKLHYLGRRYIMLGNSEIIEDIYFETKWKKLFLLLTLMPFVAAYHFFSGNPHNIKFQWFITAHDNDTYLEMLREIKNK